MTTPRAGQGDDDGRATASGQRPALCGAPAQSYVADEQSSLFPDPELERQRITAAIAARFSSYGCGTPHAPHNAIANTLKDQTPTFAFGVPVRDVVAAVLELARHDAS